MTGRAASLGPLLTRAARLTVVVLVAGVLLLVGLGSIPGSGAAGSEPPVALGPGRPNIVVVMSDDMRWDDLRFAPHVRRLMARHGIRFRNAFAPYPLCCPARASFLTGIHAHRHHVWSHEPPWGYQSFDDSRTLATSLHDAGYATGFIGKYLNGYGPMRSRVSGQPSYRYVPHGWSDWRAAFENPGVAGIHGGTYNYFDTPYNVNGHVDNSYAGRYQTTVVGDFSVAMAQRFHRAARPFFMYVNYLAPHHGTPVEPDDPGTVKGPGGLVTDFLTPARPPSVRGRFDDVVRHAAGMPSDGGPAEADTSDKPEPYRSWPEPNRRERRAMLEVTRQRGEAIWVMDQQVARLVRTLKATGEWSSTVFVFTSDNGYYLGEHRKRQGKVTGHEPSLRIPMLLTGPGMRGGRAGGHVRDDPITLLDLSATIVDLARATPPYDPDGASRTATILRGDRGWRVPVLHESGWTGTTTEHGFHDPRTSIGVRTARYALLRYRHFDELYDLWTDPREDHNVWGDPAYATVRRALGRVWWQLKDCVGSGCQVALPASLAVGPARDHELTRHYFADMRRIYG